MPQQQRWMVQRGGLTAQQILNNYLLSLGAFLLFDGTMTGDLTKVKNLGSGGATYDATPTDVTIDMDGMNFNGTTSILTVPNNAAYANALITSQVIAHTRVNAGEGGNGTYFMFASNNNRLLNSTATALAARRITSGTNPQAVTTTSFTNAVPGVLYMEYDDSGDRLIHLYKGVAGAVAEFAYSAQPAATGTLSAEANSLNIGNDASAALTFNGEFRFFAWFNRVLTAAEKLQITKMLGY